MKFRDVSAETQIQEQRLLRKTFLYLEDAIDSI